MNIVYTTQFKRDYKRLAKQNKDMTALRVVVESLTDRKKPAAKYKDHKLSGHWEKHRECHIKPDWLLIYRIDSNQLILERMGSHSDLYK